MNARGCAKLFFFVAFFALLVHQGDTTVTSESVVLAADGTSSSENHQLHPPEEAASSNGDGSSVNGTYRGKVLTPGPLHMDDLYQAYREIQTSYQNKTLGASNDWKVLNVKDGVEVAILEHEGDPTCPYVRMRATLPVPVQDCWDFLRVDNWDRTMPLMDPFYEGVSVHGNFTHPAVDMLLCRKRMTRIFTFGKRDLVFLSVTEKEPLEDGTWVSGTVSVHTDSLPRQPGYTRAFQDSVAFYKPTDQNHTDLTIVCRIDLNDSSGGGWIPMWLYVKTIGYTGAESVLRMRNALVQAAQLSADTTA